VLVVEDDAMIRSLLAEVLRDEGYTVETAADGAAALAVVRRWPPDVILLDLNMPVLDGWGFLTAYRREPAPRARIGATSATVNAAQWAEVAGADAFLAKPFDLDAVLALVHDLVRRAARARDKNPASNPAPGVPPSQPPGPADGPPAGSPPAAR
jgi:two-component system response regulator HydG